MSGRGEVWMAGTALCFAAANLFDQVAMTRADPFVAAIVKAFLVSAFALLVLAASPQRRLALLSEGWRRWLEAARIYAFAGLVSEVIGTAAFFQAMKLGGINIATPTVQTWLIWAALGGAVFLQERVQPKTFLGLALSVAGLVLLAYFQQRGLPFTPEWPKAIPFGLIAAFGWAGSTVLIRKGQTAGIDRYVGLSIQFLTALLGLLIVILCTNRGALFLQTPARTYGCLFVSALLAGVLGMVCMYIALALSPVERVIPIVACYPVLAAIAGALFLGNYLNVGMVTGIVLVAGGVAICKGKWPVGLGRWTR